MSFRIGQAVELIRSYSKDDLVAYARLGGGQTCDLVPEPLIGALFSYLLGVKLPGFGTNYLKQEMRFMMPAPLNIGLVARVEITRLRPEKHLADLETTCRLPDGTLICTGRALVSVRDVA